MPKVKKPRYSEVADQLMFGIVQGRYPLGTSLPSEAELCMRHDVSRHTVREAIRQLEVRGLVSRHQGRGTYVQRAHALPPVGLLMSTVDEVGRYGRLTHLVDVHMDDVVADAALAELLSCAKGDRYVHLRGFRVPRNAADQVPRAWSEAYVPERFSAVRSEIDGFKGAIYALIEQRFGERVGSIRQESAAIALAGEAARRLEVKRGTAGLRVKRTYLNRQAQPILVGLNTYIGSEFTLVMELRKAAINDL
jgi:GntR family transcriptional regulator